MATESTCACGHPQSSHEADDKYCYDCDCELFAPASTDALRAAAQACVDDAPVCPCPGCRLEHEAHLAALRTALDGVPAPEPVALTEAERGRLDDKLRGAALFVAFHDEPGTERSPKERAHLGVGAVLAELAAMGITLHREPLT